jgi:hypothetical protein
MTAPLAFAIGVAAAALVTALYAAARIVHTSIGRLMERRDQMVTAALDEPDDPWDVDLRHLIDEATG